MHAESRLAFLFKLFAGLVYVVEQRLWLGAVTPGSQAISLNNAAPCLGPRGEKSNGKTQTVWSLLTGGFTGHTSSIKQCWLAFSTLDI